MKLGGRDIPPKLSLAIRLQWTLIVGGPSPAPDVLQILEECNHDRMSILKKEVDLCQGVDTAMAYCILSNAYVFMGAAYRREAILYLKKYLSNPDWIPCLEKDRLRYLASRWNYLGKAYEGERQFNEAIYAFDQQRYLEPNMPAAYVSIAQTMLKMRQLPLAIEFLRSTKNTKYYREPLFGSCFKTTIDSKLADFEEKLKRGYVYRPRKNK